MKRTLLFALVTIPVWGCVAGASPIATSDLEAVSRSTPVIDASRALDACSITDTQGVLAPNALLGLDLVTGMGRVEHARDAVLYVPLLPTNPELQTDNPAWLIATKGPMYNPLIGTTDWDSTCVVIEGVATWFVTGRSEVDGKTVTPPPVPIPSTKLLPPLAP